MQVANPNEIRTALVALEEAEYHAMQARREVENRHRELVATLAFQPYAVEVLTVRRTRLREILQNEK